MADENTTTAASLRAIQEAVLSSQAAAVAASSSEIIASKQPPSTATSSSGVPSNNTETTTATTTATKQSSSSQNIEFEPPAACIRRLLKQALPKSTNVSKDSLAAISRASGIFVLYLTACANDVAREGKRTTIVAKDVMAALKELEFDDFVPLMEKFLEGHRKEEKTKKEEKERIKKAKEDKDSNKERDSHGLFVAKAKEGDVDETKGGTSDVNKAAAEGGGETKADDAMSKNNDGDMVDAEKSAVAAATTAEGEVKHPREDNEGGDNDEDEPSAKKAKIADDEQ